MSGPAWHRVATGAVAHLVGPAHGEWRFTECGLVLHADERLSPDGAARRCKKCLRAEPVEEVEPPAPAVGPPAPCRPRDPGAGDVRRLIAGLTHLTVPTPVRSRVIDLGAAVALCALLLAGCAATDDRPASGPGHPAPLPLDLRWPYAVILPADQVCTGGYEEAMAAAGTNWAVIDGALFVRAEVLVGWYQGGALEAVEVRR